MSALRSVPLALRPPLWLWLVLVLLASGEGQEPEFNRPIANVSVPVGRDAVLSCNVNHLDGYQVGWVKADTKAIQAIDTTVVTHDTRVSVEYASNPTLNGTKDWKLVIKSVRREDAGAYMCQINTDPMKSQVGFLDVTEPPNIDDEATPSEQRIMEKSAMRLSCTATGRPSPKITWRREDRKELRNDACRDSSAKSLHPSGRHSSGLVATSVVESHLCSNQVSRYHMGSYLCIASNGVLPSVSKRINLIVMFAPTVRTELQMIGAPLGITVHLECLVEASPTGIDLWYKDGEMVVSSEHYSTSVLKSSLYAYKMTLTIQRFRPSDVGRYVCRAKNSLGEDDSSIRLYEMSPRTRENSVPSARTTTSPTVAAGADKQQTAPSTLPTTTPRTTRHPISTAGTTTDSSNLLVAKNRLKPTAPVPPRQTKTSSSSRSSAACQSPLLLLLLVTCSARHWFND